MNKTADTTVLPHWLRYWEQFWFTPADPSLLGLIRITTGIIVVYTLFAYSFSLPEFMGEYAWQDMHMRMSTVRDLPVTAGPFGWTLEVPLPPPKTQFETAYVEDYMKKFHVTPPPPYPRNEDQAAKLEKFRLKYNVDVRIYGLPVPRDEDEWKYAEEYTETTKGFPPPAFARDQAEAEAIYEYIKNTGHDPRRVYTRGMRIFSLWFHVLDPNAMAVLHTLIVVCAFLFTIGFCTRLTSALTWFGSLCYIHRNPTMLFGVDTMVTILLLYLMIGPSGAAYSVDNLIARWWAKAKPGVVQGWFRFWRRSVPGLDQIAPAAAPVIVPSVAANVAIRLLQINVCMIYFVAGISKLQGTSWWTGDAIWGTIGNFEFAPMKHSIYLDFLAFIGQHRWLYALIMTGGGMFTLTFEIAYIFLIWRPRLRWVFLASAILLHGLIGVLMGLGTFALVMLVMNMAFLRKEEVYWLVGWFGAGPAASIAAPAPAPLQPAAAIATAIKT
jgi:hypothetical protein